MSLRIARVGLGCWLLGALLVLAGAARAADGKELFVGGKCVRCHSVEAAGVAAKPKAGKEDEVKDLSKVGDERTAEWIQRFLLKQETIKGKKHKQKFRGSDEELKTLATWLVSLK